MKKLINYFRLIKYLNNSTLHLAWFKIVKSIMEFATEVQQHGKPMVTKIAVVDMSAEKIIGDFDMVSIWAGVGDANPLERTKHLKAQVTELKRLLNLCKDKVDKIGNEDLLTNVNIVLGTFE